LSLQITNLVRLQQVVTMRILPMKRASPDRVWNPVGAKPTATPKIEEQIATPDLWFLATITAKDTILIFPEPGWNKFRPYKMNRAYGSDMQIQ
jgi:hypothetical protein